MPIHAVIVGSKNRAERLLKLYRPSFTYEVFENVDDEILARLYSSADVFLFMSYAEGFGLPRLRLWRVVRPWSLQTARAIGTTRSTAGMRWWFRLGNSETMANAVIKLLKDEKSRTRLINNDLEMERKFTWDGVTDAFEEAIRG